MTYKGTLIQDVPNLGIIVGYTNAPWTLKADLSARYLCRLFNYMDEKQLRVFTPRAPQGEMLDENRSEEHTSELQSLMRNSYAVFCLKKKKSKSTMIILKTTYITNRMNHSK